MQDTLLPKHSGVGWFRIGCLYCVGLGKEGCLRGQQGLLQYSCANRTQYNAPPSKVLLFPPLPNHKEDKEDLYAGDKLQPMVLLLSFCEYWYYP